MQLLDEKGVVLGIGFCARSDGSELAEVFVPMFGTHGSVLRLRRFTGVLIPILGIRGFLFFL